MENVSTRDAVAPWAGTRRFAAIIAATRSIRISLRSRATAAIQTASDRGVLRAVFNKAHRDTVAQPYLYALF